MWIIAKFQKIVPSQLEIGAWEISKKLNDYKNKYEVVSLHFLSLTTCFFVVKLSGKKKKISPLCY